MEPLPETEEALDEYLEEDDSDLRAVLMELGRRAVELVPSCVGLSLGMVKDGLTFTLVATAERWLHRRRAVPRRWTVRGRGHRLRRPRCGHPRPAGRGTVVGVRDDQRGVRCADHPVSSRPARRPPHRGRQPVRRGAPRVRGQARGAGHGSGSLGRRGRGRRGPRVHLSRPSGPDTRDHGGPAHRRHGRRHSRRPRTHRRRHRTDSAPGLGHASRSEPRAGGESRRLPAHTQLDS